MEEFKIGDIVYNGWKYGGEIIIRKYKILKINPKTFNLMDLNIKGCKDTIKFNETTGHRYKHIFRTYEECYNFCK